jgi:hypothetical protein
MARTVAARLSEAFRYSAVFYWENVNDIAEKLTDEEGRNIDTFDVLDKSIHDIPHELIERTIQLRAKNSKAFENSLTALCGSICDSFRPVTGAEFVERLNDDIRSEIEFGKSEGRDVASEVRKLEVALVTPVAAGN